MNWSRFIAIISILNVAASGLAATVGQISPKTAAIALGISAVTSAVTERVQGGASKIGKAE